MSLQGEWKPKQIDNPEYKGAWVHPEIDNPEYTHDATMYKFDNIGVLGLDLWQVIMTTHLVPSDTYRLLSCVVKFQDTAELKQDNSHLSGIPE